MMLGIMAGSNSSLVALAICGAVGIMASPARAQDGDRALLATFCDAANIRGSACTRAKAYPDTAGRACDVKLSKDRYTGRFAAAGPALLVIAYDSGCEPHATDFGGAVVFEQAGTATRFNGFLPGAQPRNCVTLPKDKRQDLLVCITGHMGQGHLETGVALMNFTRNYSKGIAISPDFLMTAEDSIGAYGANVVTCKEQSHYFGVSKLSPGPRPGTVIADITYADAETIRTACGKGFPKPKEVFGELAPGDAYVPPGYEKTGRIMIDLTNREVTPAR